MTSTNGEEILDFRPSMRQTMVITKKSLETDGSISRVEIDLEAGQGGPPAHIHPAQREIYTVHAGELVVVIEGKSNVIAAGESIEVPTGSAHSFANQSDKLARFSAEHLPALQFEEYIRLIHRTVEGKKATLPVIMRIVRIESSYGDTIMAPPGIPRVLGKVLSGVGRLVGYPTGKELAASFFQQAPSRPASQKPMN
jgi:mannose-6-phosphate isomerase-like protein (cupin superfamily)